MERKYLFTNRLDNGVAIMRLDKGIGPNSRNPNEPYINGIQFAEEIHYHTRQGRKVQVRINSVGGQMLDAFNILDAVIVCDADTHAYGLAASFAGVILACGKKRTADAHAIGMLHGAQTPDPKAKNSPVVTAFTNSLTTILRERTKFGDKLEAMMGDGDHFFDASEMLSYGMIDEVVPSTVKISKRANASAPELAAIFNSLDTKPKNTMEWWKFGFGASSEEQGISNALEIKKAKEQADAEVIRLTAVVASLDAKVTELKNTLAAKSSESEVAKATQLVENAITAKILVVKDDAEKASLIALARNNFEVVKSLIDRAKSTTRPSVMEVMNADGTRNPKMTYEYLAKNDPEKLGQILENDPDLYARLELEYKEAQTKTA